MKKGILLLSHCGFSFMEDLCEITNHLGLESFVLSSEPLTQVDERITQLQAMSKELRVINKHYLTWKDLEITLQQLTLKNKQVIACLSVWEGYRSLMAQANLYLGANDIGLTEVALLRDKLTLRKELYKKGLTHINVELLAPIHLEKYKNHLIKKFIKPRKGIASYGAFSLKTMTDWSTIEKVKNQILNDKEYHSIFDQQLDFIIEDYIAGKEYSFEIIAENKTPFIIAIHEKIDLHEKESTVLESACISPPLSLSKKDIIEATQWMKKIFYALNLTCGCYHVEAKYHAGTWEIIEINPRVGGAFIAQSVQLLTQGHHLLSLWITSLISETKNDFIHTLRQLSTEDESFFIRKIHTFFRVFFATEKGVIKAIHIQDIAKKPSQIKIFVNPGYAIPHSSREVFIAQALWALSECDEIRQIPALLSDSKQLLEVQYE